MIPVDLWACVASGVACVALGVRSKMLRPHRDVWAPAPWPVWAGLMALAIACGMNAVALGNGAHATAREAFVLTVLAAAAVVMLANLNRNGRGWDLAKVFQGRRGLIDMIMMRLDPPAREVFTRAVEGSRKPDGGGA